MDGKFERARVITSAHTCKKRKQNKQASKQTVISDL